MMSLSLQIHRDWPLWELIPKEQVIIYLSLYVVLYFLRHSTIFFSFNESGNDVWLCDIWKSK